MYFKHRHVHLHWSRINRKTKVTSTRGHLNIFASKAHEISIYRFGLKLRYYFWRDSNVTAVLFRLDNDVLRRLCFFCLFVCFFVSKVRESRRHSRQVVRNEAGYRIRKRANRTIGWKTSENAPLVSLLPSRSRDNCTKKRTRAAAAAVTKFFVKHSKKHAFASIRRHGDKIIYILNAKLYTIISILINVYV